MDFWVSVFVTLVTIHRQPFLPPCCKISYVPFLIWKSFTQSFVNHALRILFISQNTSNRHHDEFRHPRRNYINYVKLHKSTSECNTWEKHFGYTKSVNVQWHCTVTKDTISPRTVPCWTAMVKRLTARRCPTNSEGQRAVQAGRDAPSGSKESGKAEPITHATCCMDLRNLATKKKCKITP